MVLQITVVTVHNGITRAIQFAFYFPAQRSVGNGAAIAIQSGLFRVTITRCAISKTGTIFCFNCKIVGMTGRTTHGFHHHIGIDFGAILGTHCAIRRALNQQQTFAIQTKTIGISPC